MLHVAHVIGVLVRLFVSQIREQWLAIIAIVIASIIISVIQMREMKKPENQNDETEKN